MQVSVEKVNSVERRLTIVVPADQVTAAYEKQIQQYAQKANIKGFRPGKAPIAFIKQRFGNDAHQEAVGEVMRKALFDAITANDLKPVSTPQVEPKTLGLNNQPLEFIALIEVLPEIDNIQFTLEAAEKLIVEVISTDIDRVIGHLRKQHTQWNKVDRATKEKDRVVIDYHTVYEGIADMEHAVKNYTLELGSKVMLPGFEEGLMGAAVGDVRTLNLHFPADFKMTEKAGKPVDFVVEIKQIYEADTPAVDDAFIHKLGIKSGLEADLRAQIQRSLEQERNRLVKEKLKEQVFQKLLEQNPLDVPKALVAQEAQHIHDEIYPQHKQHDHHQHSAEETAAFSDIAKKRVILGLLINEYAKQANITVDKARVDQRIQEVASAYEHAQEVIAWLSSSKEQRAGIEAQVTEDQVLDKLLEAVKITEKMISYAELTGVNV